jgi:hypothetical protein
MDKCEGCPFRGFGSWDEDDDDGIGRHTPGTCLIGHKNNFRAKDCHLDCEQWDAILQAIAGEGRLRFEERRCGKCKHVSAYHNGTHLAAWCGARKTEVPENIDPELCEDFDWQDQGGK